MLDNPNEPVSDLSYFDCIESVMENSKVALFESHRITHFDLSILNLLTYLFLLLLFVFVLLRCSLQVLGESMAGISMNCKNGDVPAFGDCVGSASKALCGLTEAAGQVQRGAGSQLWHTVHYITSQCWC